MQPALCRARRSPGFHLICLLVFYGSLTSVRSTCPTQSQRRSLVRAAEAVSVRCHCDSDRPDEWEVTCIKDSPSVTDTNASGHLSLTGPQPSFVLKFLNANTIEITCDESLPDFKPAMFQGFNIDAVDTFKLSNCMLPVVPLSVIFHRTALSRLHHREEGTNTSHSDEEVVSEVRSLSIEFPTPHKFTAGHLKNLFNGLDALEKLTLHNVQFGGAGDHGSSLTPPASVFYARPKRAADTISSGTSLKTAESRDHTFPSTDVFATDAPETWTTSLPSFATSTLRSPSSTGARDSATSVHLSTSAPSISSRTNSPFTAGTARSESRPETLPAKKDSMSGEAGTQPDQKPPAGLQPDSAIDLRLSSLLPKLRSVNINAMFPEGMTSSGMTLQRMLKDLKNLESVRLTGNFVHELHEHTFSGSASSLKFLYLFGNSIRSLHPRIFSNLFNLQFLDLFNNNLTVLPTGIFADLTSLSTLRIGKNKFEFLAEDLLWPIRGLKAIDLNLNRNLTFLPARFLAGCPQLQNFSLTDCDLQQLSSDSSSFFAAAPSLERIEMRGNRLRNLTAPALFAGNPQLRKIDLSYNSITSLSPSIFSSNSSSIAELNLHGNELTVIDSSTLDLTQLKNLRLLKLGFNNIVHFSPDVLFSLRKLEELDLSRNHLSSVNPQHSRLPFGQGSASLRRLNLARNNLTDFSEFSAIDWSLYLKIAEVDLSRNQIKGPVLLPVVYSTAPVVVLDLSSNDIRSIQMAEILQYEAGVSEEARDGRMSQSFEERSLSWRPSQVIIRLDRNPLNCDCRLEPFLTYANASSRDLDGALRGILSRVSFDFFSPNLQCDQPPNLAHTPLSKVDPWNLTCLVEDPRFCPSDCICLYRTRDKHAYVNCENHNWESIPDDLLLPQRYKNVTLWENGLHERLPVQTVSLLLSNNAISDIRNLHRLQSEQEPELLSGDAIHFEVYLDNNHIESVPEDLLKQRKGDEDEDSEASSGVGGEFAVQVLSLRNNYLQRIPFSFLQSIRASSASSTASQNSSDLPVRLFLGGNPYNCSSQERSSLPANISDCGLIFFKSWLTKNYDIVPDVKQVTCNIWRKSVSADVPEPIVQIPDAELCPQLLLSNEGSFFILSILCLIFSVISLILCVTYYRNKQTVLAFIYIHVQPVFVCLNFSEQDLDEDKLYDAFVSYSSSDRDIVMEMIAELEGQNDTTEDSISFLKQQTGIPSIHEGNSDQIIPEHAVHGNKSSKRLQGRDISGSYFTLCVHERDWLPGNLISWNIVNSVQNSRRTILILSKEFIRSIWFQVEFHTAYYQMLEDKMDRLIVVVRGDLPPKEEMDKDLVFLLTTKTYLTWGEKWFWEKLRYALPHKKGALPAKLPDPKEKANYSVAMNGRTKQSKADLMKQYVDQTISDHFQLQQKTPDRLFDPNPCRSSPTSSPKRGHVNQSFVSESEA